MTWHQTDDLKEFATAVEPLLSGQPERYTVLASVLDGLLEHGPHLFGADPPLLLWWSSAGQARAAALQTPPHPLQITTLPGSSAGELAELLVTDHGPGIRQVNGGERDATAFASAWCDRTGQRYRTDKRMRLYRLVQLTPPDPGPDGASRVGTPADRDTERAWNAAFHREAVPESPPPEEVRLKADAGRLVLWELSGTPVSMAGFTSAIAGVARIAPVYTPPEHRNHGYGGAATVAATRLTIDAGATSVVLFTDLANPVSNALYIKLGYQAVEDKVILAIEPQPKEQRYDR